jgi:serine/threonine-protein kinase
MARSLIIVGSMLGLLAVAVAGWRRWRPAPVPSLARYPLALAEQNTLFPVALSPDGSALAYTGASADNAAQIWIKRRESAVPEPVNGTDNAVTFAFSPDSRSLAFVSADGRVRTVARFGGSPATLASGASHIGGVAWTDDGHIAYVDRSGRTLLRVPASGGTPDSLALAESPDARHWFGYVTAMPGSRGIVISRCDDDLSCGSSSQLFLVDLERRTLRGLIPDGRRAVLVDSSVLVYADRAGALHATLFDLRSLEVRGAAVPLGDTVRVLLTGQPQFDASISGTLVTHRAVDHSRERHELVWVTRSGTEMVAAPDFQFLPTRYGGNVAWALSPDGSRVALGMNTASGDNLWVKQLPGGPMVRLTRDSLPAFRPRWSRDGQWIFFHWWRAGRAAYYRVDAQGTREPALVMEGPPGPGIFEAIWARDERMLLLRAGGVTGTTGARDLFVATPSESQSVRPLLASPQYDESGAALSPDGRWLLYESDETGRTEIYLRPFPNVQDGKWTVSVAGGRAPLWSRNGRELFFVNAERALVSMTFAANDAAPQLGIPTILFRLRPELYLAPREHYTPFDIAPDGQRFLMARVAESERARAAPLVITEHWVADVRQRLQR